MEDEIAMMIACEIVNDEFAFMPQTAQESEPIVFSQWDDEDY